MGKVLKVSMLGDLQITLDGREIQLPGGVYSKTTRLFLLTVLCGEKGIPRQNILDLLYGDGEYMDDSGSLRVATFRLKNYLTDAGILTKEGSIHKRGVFKLCEDGLRVVTDVDEFEAAVKLAWDEDSAEAQIDRLKKACRLYRGDFLFALSGERWVAGRQATYQNMYFRCMGRYLDLLTRKEDYEKVLSVARELIHVYPYEEWHVRELDALIGMERWREAKEVAERASQNLMDSMGVHPSGAMEDRIRTITIHLNGSAKNLMEIQRELEETASDSGAYYCSYPSFVGAYQYELRRIERTGESLYLVLCSLMEKEGTRPQEGQFEKALEQLEAAIRISLRRTDIYTRYGQNQYLLLLEGLKREDCPAISARIENNFEKGFGGERFRIRHFMAPVAAGGGPAKPEPLKFNQKMWKIV